jgi:hypothetical protein
MNPHFAYKIIDERDVKPKNCTYAQAITSSIIAAGFETAFQKIKKRKNAKKNNIRSDINR